MYFSYKEMGNRIVQKRRELRISQKQLAEKLSISNNHLSNIENGKAAPSLELFFLICSELHVSSDFLIFDLIHPNVDESLVEKINLCNEENKILLSKMVDFFLYTQELEK